MANRVKENDPAGMVIFLGVGAVVIVCFCLGYFIIGKGLPGSGPAPGTAPVAAQGGGGTSPTVVQKAQPTPAAGNVTIIDNTPAVDAAKKKAADDAKKKADALAAKKKADDAAKLLAASAVASPAPDASPAVDPDDSPAPVDTPAPDATPAPDNPPATTPADSGESKPPATKPTTPNVAPPDADDYNAASNSTTVASNSSGTISSGPLYRVRVGTFGDKENADSLATDLKGHGYATSLSTETVDGKTIYRLQVGAYRSEKTAREFAKELEKSGYKTTITLH